MGVEVSDTAGLAREPATLVPPARGIDSSAGGPGITGSARLALIGALLCELHQADIHYCHWKSNEHLAASLEGKTDLDLLVAPADLGPLAGILLNLGFKRCVTVEGRGYPGIESYLGLDDATGTLVHLHLHYQLTIGERFLKGYRVPWEALALAGRKRMGQEDVYVMEPHLELLLLVVRVALKVRWRDRLRGLLGRGQVSEGARRELAWLTARVEPARLQALATDLVGARAAQSLASIIAAPVPGAADFYRFRRHVRPHLWEYRTYREPEARLRRWVREIRSRRLGRRRLPRGGVVIALLGADGSGKSTVTRELAAWLSRHLDVVLLYFGSGKGSASPLRRTAESAARAVVFASRRQRVANRGTRRGQRASGAATAGDMIWVLLLARERRRRAAQARRARNQGIIVLCDRFPQSQFARSDGPWLREWMAHRSLLRRWIARAELAAIEVAERLRPDLVIKLRVTADVARGRKADTPMPALQAKIEIIEQLNFPEGTSVVEIDASAPLEQVLLEARRQVWAHL